MSSAMIFKDGKTLEDKRAPLDLKTLSPEEQKIADQLQKKYKAILTSQYQREIAIQNGKDSIERNNPLVDRQELDKANALREARKHGWSIKTNGDLVKLDLPAASSIKIPSDEKETSKDKKSESTPKSTANKPSDSVAQLSADALNLLYGRNGVTRDFAKATETANKILKLDPNNPVALIVIARDFIREGKEKESTKIIDAILKAYPKNPDALLAKADMIYMFDTGKDKVERSFKLTKEVLELDPNNIAALTSAGISYKNGKGVEKDLKQALTHLLKASELKPNDADILVMVGDLFLTLNESAEQGQKAFSYFQKAEKLQSDNLLAKTGLAQCYFNGIGTARDLKEAKVKIDEAIQINKEYEKAKKLQMQITEAMIKIISQITI